MSMESLSGIKKDYRKRVLEEGEEIQSLPYVRQRKKPNETIREAIIKKNQVKVKVDDPSKLLAANRIMTAFNDGDFELIVEIVREVSTPDCIIDLKKLNKRLIGVDALIVLWKSLFEAFPDGNFKASDTSIDHNHDVTTSFIFSGIKIFPIVILGSVPILSKEEKQIRAENKVKLMKTDFKSNCNSNSSSSTALNYQHQQYQQYEHNDANNVSAGGDLKGIRDIVTAFYHTEGVTNTASSSSFSLDRDDFSTHSSERRSSIDLSEKSLPNLDHRLQMKVSSNINSNIDESGTIQSHTKDSNLDKFYSDDISLTQNTASIDVYEPIYTTSQLLKIEAPPEYVTRGRMVFHINSNGLIKKYLFYWDNLC